MLSEDEKWFEVSLRVSGDPLDFSRVTSVAGVIPTRTCRKGEHRNGNPRYAKHNEDVWIWRVTNDTSEPFESQLKRAVEHLRGRGQEIAPIAAGSGGEAYFFLGFSSGNGQGGANLSADAIGSDRSNKTKLRHQREERTSVLSRRSATQTSTACRCRI